MSTCKGCGGTVGRDCFNPQECEWISNEQHRRANNHGSDTRIANLETALRAAQATIGGLAMEVARLRASFHVNMLRAFPEKSHDEISAEIDRATGGTIATKTGSPA